MRIACLVSLILAALFSLDARPALASPWCSTYGAVSCGYDSYDQCMMSIRGVGGNCIRNTMEPEIAQPAPVVAVQPAPAKPAEKKKPKKPVASVAPNATAQ